MNRFITSKISDITLSSDLNINSILGEFKWRISRITFSFPAENDAYRDEITFVNQIPEEDDEDDRDEDLEDGQEEWQYVPTPDPVQQAVRQTLKHVSEVVPLEFAEDTRAPATADIRFTSLSGMDSKVGGAALSSPWALVPQDVILNDKLRESGTRPGSSLYNTILHEVGHALGLMHGHGDGSSPYSVLPPDVDRQPYSLMTYTGNSADYLPQTLSQGDILALQHLYGPNYQTRNTDTVYNFSPTTGQMFVNGVGQGLPSKPAPYLTIWDGGGRDRYDFSNAHAPVTVDLRPGKMSMLLPLPSFDDSERESALGLIFNALQYDGDKRSLIEDATGGINDDRLHGNEFANHLRGNDGDDVLSGDDGDDLLEGEDGNDVLYGDQDNDRLYGGRGKDRLFGGAGSDELYGGDGADELEGGCGDDFMFGGDGNDRLFIACGHDWLEGGDGRDTFVLKTTKVWATIADFATHSRLPEKSDVIDLTWLGGTKSDAESILRDAKQTVWGVELRLEESGAIYLPSISRAELSLADFQFLDAR